MESVTVTFVGCMTFVGCIALNPQQRPAHDNRIGKKQVYLDGCFVALYPRFTRIPVQFVFMLNERLALFLG
jgi:hypothetical protein